MAQDEKFTFLNVIKFLQENEFPDCEAETLGEYLNIPPSKIRTMKYDSNTSRRILHKVIDHWFQNDSEKSWQKLAEAVELCDYSNIAEVANSKQGSTTKLSQTCNRQVKVISSSTAVCSSSLNFKSEESRKQATVRSKMSLTPVALPRKQSFIKSSSQTTQIGSSSLRSKMSQIPVALPRKQSSIKSSSQTTQIGSSSYKSRSKPRVSSELHEIEDRFTLLKESLLNELKTKPNEISVNFLKSKISCMKAEVMRYAYNSWRKIVKRTFHNLDELFTYLNADVWTIFDYYLLAYIIESLGSEQLKGKLEVYVVKLDNFKKTTLVSDFMCCWKDILHETSNPDFEKIVIKYDKALTTLADLEDDIRKKVKVKYFPALLECVSCIYYGRFQKENRGRAITFQIPEETISEEHYFQNDSNSHTGATPHDETEIPVLEFAHEEKTKVTETTGHNLIRPSSRTLPRLHSSPILPTPQENSIKDDKFPKQTVKLLGKLNHLDRSIEESQDRAEDIQRRSEERVQHLEASLTEARLALRQHEDRWNTFSAHWVIKRQEIELTGPQLGVGGWATVTMAKFRGIEVAVKRIHDQIITCHNIQLFQREMNIAARLRHPNLVQVIGATVEGDMIVMELVAISLRKQLQKDSCFQPVAVKNVSLDVARALNYLHLIQPDPIVHRDISSANVMLEELPHGKWRAKLTDYGSVNIVRELRTENPGSPAYSAPEASNPRLQSPKMDIFSFGALVLEMLTGRLPASEDRPGLLCQVHHEQLLHLIRRCLGKNPEDRPSATNIISELSS